MIPWQHPNSVEGENHIVVYFLARKENAGYFDLYVLLSKTIKSHTKTAKKIIKTLVNENMFPIRPGH